MCDASEQYYDESILCATVEMSLLITDGIETLCIRKVEISIGACAKLQCVFSAAQG